MTAKTTKTYTVVTAQGESVEVKATRVVEDEAGYLVKFYDGDDLVGVFRSYGSFRITG